MKMKDDFFAKLEEEMSGQWNIVVLHTGSFVGDAMNFMALPAKDVEKMFGKKVHGPAAMIAAIDLLKKCLVEETDRERFSELSFAEALEVVSQWHVLSTKAEETRSKERLAEEIDAAKNQVKAALEAAGLPEDFLDDIEETDGGDSEDD